MPRLSRQYGHIPGIPVGTHFDTRKALLQAGVHGEIRAGIHGVRGMAAFSICLSGGYEGDEYLGDKIIYVGTGGRAPSGVADQSFENYKNKSLCLSCERRLPVRVIRGTPKTGRYRFDTGYTYEGLYVVDSFTKKQGKSGHAMCFFELSRFTKDDSTEPSGSAGNEESAECGAESV